MQQISSFFVFLSIETWENTEKKGIPCSLTQVACLVLIEYLCRQLLPAEAPQSITKPQILNIVY